MKYWKRLRKYGKKFAFPAAVGSGIGLVSATSAMADLTTFWAAVDLTSFSTNIESLLITFVGIALLFAAYAYVKRVLPGRG